jgi:hypothetical protein
MQERFDILTAKVLAGEASAQEAAELRSLLAVDAELQAEFSRLQKMDELLRENAPIAAEIDLTENEPLPPGREQELETVLRRRFGSAEGKRATIAHPAWRFLLRPFWLATTCALIALVLASVLLLRSSAPGVVAQNGSRGYVLLEQGNAQLRHRNGKISAAAVMSFERGDILSVPAGGRIRLVVSNAVKTVAGPTEQKLDDFPSASASSTSSSRALQVALFSAPEQLLAPEVLISTRSTSAIHVYSPRGRTASLTPLFIWQAKPGEAYDLRVTDEFEAKTPPWEARNVAPPFRFAERPDWAGRPLKPFRVYQVAVALAGQPATASAYTFMTAETPISPGPRPDSAKVKDAFELLSTTPAYVGDALADLLAISEPLSSTEFVKRLKIFAFGQLGYRDEVETLVSELRR